MRNVDTRIRDWQSSMLIDIATDPDGISAESPLVTNRHRIPLIPAVRNAKPEFIRWHHAMYRCPLILAHVLILVAYTCNRETFSAHAESFNAYRNMQILPTSVYAERINERIAKS